MLKDFLSLALKTKKINKEKNQKPKRNCRPPLNWMWCDVMWGEGSSLPPSALHLARYYLCPTIVQPMGVTGVTTGGYASNGDWCAAELDRVGSVPGCLQIESKIWQSNTRPSFDGIACNTLSFKGLWTFMVAFDFVYMQVL